MRGLLLPAGLLCAAAATGLLAYLALRDTDQPADAGETTTETTRAPVAASGEPVLRPYQTTVTLTEDLRDALASGDQALVARECWRVSEALHGKARWTLLNIAAHEASPRVRALLVLANGVHVPEDRALLDFLGDRAPLVRRAAALASGYDPDGTRRLALVAGLLVPVGREPSDRGRATLERHLESEQDGSVREALAAALGGA
jgi:hypothetical protein